MRLNDAPRFTLAQLPTPVEELPRLSAELGGPTLLVKRDDQTGLALGGNKTRKLEYLLADALSVQADVLITAGGPQSNHCRQTAAAAAKVGIDCDLVLGGEPPQETNGNILLDLFCGAKLHYTTGDRDQKMQEIAGERRAAGKVPYVIPVGGSNGLGSLGYVQAAFELVEQLKTVGDVDQIVVASSSGGTHAGLVLGAKLAGLSAEILGISIDQLPTQQPTFEVELSQIAQEAADRIDAQVQIRPEDFRLNYDYLGGGYGVIGHLEREAIWKAARSDALILDPVYTGRAFGALLDLVRRDQITGKRVLFWHTGGAPALFARVEDLMLPADT